MPAPGRYPDDVREQATRLAVDARRDPDTARGAIARIARQCDINPETLRNWVRRAEAEAGEGGFAEATTGV